MADWLYAGPSVALNAWPTCVCVNPNDNLRILNCLANSLISSKFIPSTVVLSVGFPTVSEMGTIVRNIESFTVKFAQTEPWIVLGLCCLMPFSTIFRFYWWRKPEYLEKNNFILGFAIIWISLDKFSVYWWVGLDMLSVRWWVGLDRIPVYSWIGFI